MSDISVVLIARISHGSHCQLYWSVIYWSHCVTIGLVGSGLVLYWSVLFVWYWSLCVRSIDQLFIDHIDYYWLSGVFLHILADTLSSIGVIISSLLIRYWSHCIRCIDQIDLIVLDIIIVLITIDWQYRCHHFLVINPLLITLYPIRYWSDWSHCVRYIDHFDLIVSDILIVLITVDCQVCSYTFSLTPSAVSVSSFPHY